MLIISGGQLWDQSMGMFSPHLQWSHSRLCTVSVVFSLPINANEKKYNPFLAKIWHFIKPEYWADPTTGGGHFQPALTSLRW